MVNEFVGRNYICNPTSFVPVGPDYDNSTPTERVCSAVGAVAGSDVVAGADYIASSYQYYASNKWR